MFVLLTGLSLGSGLTWGQNLNLAVQQAHRASGSAGNPSSPAAPTGGAPAPAMDPAMATTLKGINELQTSFSSIAAAPDAAKAGDERITLMNEFAAAANGKKPATANIRKLANDMVHLLAAKKLSTGNSQKLARAVHAMFNGAHLPEAQQDSELTEAKKILADAGLTDAEITIILDDLKAIAAETK